MPVCYTFTTIILGVFMENMLTRKTYYATPESDRAVEEIKRRYGLSSESDALRMAAILVAESQIARIPKRKRREAPAS